MNSETIKIIIIILSVTGGLSCIYIFGGFIFKNKSSLYIKGGAYLILDVDKIGDKLEYYVRKIENDIDSRYIYISRIFLYSKTLNHTGQEKSEILEICKILTDTYSNIVFLDNANNIIDMDL
jgi:hypothetical protein